MPEFICPLCHSDITTYATRELTRQLGQPFTLRLVCPACKHTVKFSLAYSLVLTNAAAMVETEVQHA